MRCSIRFPVFAVALYILGLASVFVVVARCWTYISNETVIYSSEKPVERIAPTPNPVDGCWHVFMDAGTNRGVQVRKLFEPHLYPHSSIEGHFRKAFGNRRERIRDVCAFGFEGHPMFFSRLRQIESTYRSRGYRVKFLRQLVGTAHTKVPFFVDQTKKHDGSSVISREKTSGSYTVEAIDFAEFVRIVGRRKLPKQQGTKPRTVLLKMDVEGSEFVVLPHLIAENVLCNINITMIEWHERHFFSGQAPDSFPSSFRDRSTVTNATKAVKKESREYISQFCPWNKMMEFDDESYNGDQRPLT